MPLFKNFATYWMTEVIFDKPFLTIPNRLYSCNMVISLQLFVTVHILSISWAGLSDKCRKPSETGLVRLARQTTVPLPHLGYLFDLSACSRLIGTQ